MEVSFDEIGKSMKTPDMTQQHDDASKQTNFSGCGSVGRVGASDTKVPRFESSHRQKFMYKLNMCYCQLCIEKTKIKKKSPGMAHLKKLEKKGAGVRLYDFASIGDF